MILLERMGGLAFGEASLGGRASPVIPAEMGGSGTLERTPPLTSPLSRLRSMFSFCSFGGDDGGAVLEAC